MGRKEVGELAKEVRSHPGWPSAQHRFTSSRNLQDHTTSADTAFAHTCELM